MKNFLKVLLITALLLFLISLPFIYFFLRFKPNGISVFQWVSNKSLDLGVSSNEEQYNQFIKEIGLEVKSTECTTNSCTPKYSETVTVQKEITNEQGSALINSWGNNSKNAPFSNSQMRVNNDGTVEFSGTVSTSKLSNLLSISSDLSNEQKEMIKKYTSKIGKEFPIYAKGSLVITNNKVDLNISYLKAGIISIPGELVNEYKEEANTYIENRLNYVKGLNVERLEFKEGKTIFKGTMPKNIEFNR